MKRKLLFSVLLFGLLCIPSVSSYAASKYSYNIVNGTAQNVGAGPGYNLSNGFVGPSDTGVGGCPVYGIAAEGFAGWGSENVWLNIPATCQFVGQNAFYTTGYYGEEAISYQKALMPANHFKYFNYYGIGKRTPLVSNNGSFVCDTSIHGSTMYNGSEQEPEHFAVYCNGEVVSTEARLLSEDTTNPGTVTYEFPIIDQLTGVENTATVYGTASYDIVKYHLVNATIQPVEDMEYTGEALTPEVDISAPTWENGDLEEGVDYTISYENNVNAGRGNIKITGIGNCEGVINIPFNILPTDNWILEECRDSYHYEAREIKPKPNRVYYQYKNNPYEMIEGKDYVLSYENNINKGTATVTVSGIGNFCGSDSWDFEIYAYSLNFERVECDLEPQYGLNGMDEVCPIPKNVHIGNLFTLVREQDYKLSWEDNDEPGTGQVIIEGINNFDGEVSFPFTIVECAVNEPNSVVSDAANTSFNEDGTPIVKEELASFTVSKTVTKNITIKWKKVKKAKKYVIYQKKSGKYKKIATTKKLKITRKNLTKGKTYKFRICAVNAKGKKLKQINKTIKVK